jgi:hypothetical protein
MTQSTYLPFVLCVFLTSEDLSHHSYSPILRYSSNDGNAWNTRAQCFGCVVSRVLAVLQLLDRAVSQPCPVADNNLHGPPLGKY